MIEIPIKGWKFVCSFCFLQWGLSVKNYIGQLCEYNDLLDCLVRERQQEDVKLKLCTKPQQITEAEGTVTTAYSRMTIPSSFGQDEHVSGPSKFTCRMFCLML